MLFTITDTAPTETYTLSLHDALPISSLTPETAAVLLTLGQRGIRHVVFARYDDHPLRLREVLSQEEARAASRLLDRKSTRLNSSHTVISYAVFCLKKKKPNTQTTFNF